MSARDLMTLAFLATACTGGGGTDTDKPVDGDADADADSDADADVTGTTGTTGPDGFSPAYLTVDAHLGYNSQNRTIVPVGTPYGDIPSAINISMGDDSWQASNFDPADVSAYCIIQLPLDNPVPPPWIATNGLWYGTDYNPASGAGTDCGTPGFELDPYYWGYPPDFGWGLYGFGVGIGELKAEYVEYYSTSPYAAFFFGGQIQNTALPAPEGQEGYVAFARAIDNGNQLIIDASNQLTLIEGTEVFLGNNIRSGSYLINPRLIWIFQ